MKGYAYTLVEQAWKTKFLTSQADSGCLAVRPASSLQTRFLVAGLDLQNRSGSTIVAGLAGRLPVSLWKAGQVTAAGAWTDDTTNAQSNTSDAFLLGTGGSANSGIIVLSRIPFNVLSVVTTTQATAGTTFDLSYSTGTSTWTTITGALVAPDWTPAAGEQLVCWPKPGGDWAVVTTSHATGLPTDGAGWYGIRIRETANNTAAGKARVLVLGIAYGLVNGLANSLIESVNPGEGELWLAPQVDGLAALCSVAADGNGAAVRYRMMG